MPDNWWLAFVVPQQIAIIDDMNTTVIWKDTQYTGHIQAYLKDVMIRHIPSFNHLNFNNAHFVYTDIQISIFVRQVSDYC